MKAAEICYECLKRLVLQASGSATNDPVLCERAQKTGLAVLDKYFSTNIVTIEIATKIHQAVKDATGNPDPYRAMKDREIAISREWYNSVKPVSYSDMRACFEIAAKGNVIDFFRPFEQIKSDLDRKVDFIIDNFDRLEKELARAKTVLYLADNAGEVFFDLHFIRCLSRLARVTYVVKALPVQNDITIDDIKKAGLWDEFKGIEVITTGTATPGIIMSQASAEFLKAYKETDLVFAKGMGYWETLSELPAENRVFHCLVAKCQPVADSLGVKLNSFVGLMR